MAEFLNRVDAQRELLKAVNLRHCWSEPLLGLSAPAITRWAEASFLRKDGELVGQVLEASKCISMLANKSQEQITEDYSRVEERFRLHLARVVACLVQA